MCDGYRMVTVRTIQGGLVPASHRNENGISLRQDIRQAMSARPSGSLALGFRRLPEKHVPCCEGFSLVFKECRRAHSQAM